MTTDRAWVDPPDPSLDIDYWTVTGDLRPPLSDDPFDDSDEAEHANYDCRDALRPRFPNIDFDPETSCFFAYAKSAAEAEALLAAIREWIAS